MLRKLVNPMVAIKFLAGLSALLFERLTGVDAMSAGGADDLTRINGIGPTFARRLAEAGVVSFHQLAALTPEVIADITGLAAWQADPADWIEQAAALA